jgi:hypothetical protein
VSTETGEGQYLSAMEAADRQEDEVQRAKSARLKEKIAALREQVRRIRDMEPDVHGAPDHRPRWALDGHERQGHRGGRLQRAGRRRRQAPPDRGARADEPRPRPRPAVSDGGAGPRSDGPRRTANPIESVFATVRHRTVRTKGALSQDTARLMVFKLVMAAAKTWRRLNGENQLPKVVQGVTFRDGVEVTNTPEQTAA